MKTLVERTSERKGVTTPHRFTDKEFRAEIRKAEKGPFISLDELDRRPEEWKNLKQ